MALEDQFLERGFGPDPEILDRDELLKTPAVGTNSAMLGALAPQSDWTDMSDSEHFVQCYESEGFLLTSLNGYIGAGLAESDACIVVGRESTRQGLADRLQADGFDLAVLAASGHYVPLDAADLLRQFMHDGLPEPKSFANLLEEILGRLPRERRGVRIFGEMVALLWSEGNFPGAIHLEKLWTDLQKDHAFSLFCGYPLNVFGGGALPDSFDHVCSAHSRVIPAESYVKLVDADERLRAIARLQQKANSFEAEVAERKAIAARFRFLAEAMPQKIFIAEPNGDIHYFNHQWTEFTGLPLDQIEGWAEFTHPDDLNENLSRWQQSIDSGEPFQCEHRIRRADDVYQWHLTCAQRMHDSVGNVSMWVGWTIDIDDRKRTEEALRQSEVALNRSLRLRDEFLSGVSHDLKTPLAIVKGQAQLLQRRVTRGKLDDDALLAGLDQIEAKSRMMADLIDELLDVTRLRAGESLELDRRTIDLVALVQDAVAGLRETMGEHSLEVQAQEPYLNGSWDAVRLRRVVGNLISNALKYSPDGGTITVTISHQKSSDLDEAVLTVMDEGMGIPSDDLPHIFEQFYRGMNARVAADGTGLGLTGVKHIVEQHGGTVAVESQEGVGTTFSVRLPLEPAP